MFQGARSLTFILFGMFAAAVIAPAQVTFKQTAAINSGDTSSIGIATGDFNNDGILDLVTVNFGTLSFYKGLGGATYANPVNQTLTQGQLQVFSADFNGDGKLDLAIAGNAGFVTILLGNGDGTFKQGTNITISGTASSITLADFNGDHKPDIAISDGPDDMTWVYLGQGDGTFKLSQTEYYGGATIVAGDFNADGKQDLVFASNSVVGLFLGNGDGTFGTLLEAPLSNVTQLAVGDFYNNRTQTLAAVVTVDLGSGTNDGYIYSLRYSHFRLYDWQRQWNLRGAGDRSVDRRCPVVFAGSRPRSGWSTRCRDSLDLVQRCGWRRRSAA
jgi:hypothetical protein